MIWKIPPRIKVYEALGCIADGRIERNGNEAKVYSSARMVSYLVVYDPKTKSISSNDNGSYWQHYLGYPAIAYLMEIGMLPFDKECAAALAHIHWKTINSKFHNDWSKTEAWIYTQVLPKTTVTKERLEQIAQAVLEKMKKEEFKQLPNSVPPPKFAFKK